MALVFMGGRGQQVGRGRRLNDAALTASLRMTPSLKIAIAAGVLALGVVAVYLDVQLNRTQADAAAVAAERDQAKAAVSQLSTKVDQLQTATEQLSAANVRESMPELPVSVNFHRALLGGRSYVAEFSVTTQST